jgi:hypothetical protein
MEDVSMRSAFGSLTIGFIIMMIFLVIFVSILVPQMSMADHQNGRGMSACLPSFFGQGPPSPSQDATSAVSTSALSLAGGATRCLGNQTVVQAALAIVAHLHGDPDVNWDKRMPEQVVTYWASTCPAGSGCWIDWQNTHLQCVMLVKGAYALAGAPLPVAGNAIDFWSLYAHRPGWSEILSATAPRHLPLPGDIMVWSHSTLGHIAIVTAVVPPTNGGSGSITFAQANQTGSFLHGRFVPGLVTQTMQSNLSVLTWPDYQVVGYIRPNSVYLDLAAQDAHVAGIDPTLFERLIQVESGFDPGAVSATGAVGIAQFLPSTAAALTPPLDPTDPVASLAAAAQDLASKVRTYGGDDAKALAAYQIGDTPVQDAVVRYGINWLAHLPTETITSVNRIANHP